MVAMKVFFESMFFKSAGSISETIFIQSTRNFAHFFLLDYQVKYLRVVLSEKLSDLWPVFDDFVVKNMNFDFKLTQMFNILKI